MANKQKEALAQDMRKRSRKLHENLFLKEQGASLCKLNLNIFFFVKLFRLLLSYHPLGEIFKVFKNFAS